MQVAAGARRVVVLEAAANPDNVGGVFRNAAAFGVDAVLLSPTLLRPLVSQGDSHLDGGDPARPFRARGAVARRLERAPPPGYLAGGLHSRS